MRRRTRNPHRRTDVRWGANMPYDALTVILPLPVGSHTSPIRGANWFSLLLVGALPGIGSPGKVRPAGALGYTVLCTFCKKAVWLN